MLLVTCVRACSACWFFFILFLGVEIALNTALTPLTDQMATTKDDKDAARSNIKASFVRAIRTKDDSVPPVCVECQNEIERWKIASSLRLVAIE